MTYQIVAKNIDVITAQKLAQLLDRCTCEPLNMTLQEVIDGLEEIAARANTDRFKAFLHKANGDLLSVTSEGEYQKHLDSGVWFKTPRDAENALDETSKKLAEEKRHLAEEQGRKNGKGAQVVNAHDPSGVPIKGKDLNIDEKTRNK
jgi:hypothetical protein